MEGLFRGKRFPLVGSYVRKKARFVTAPVTLDLDGNGFINHDSTLVSDHFVGGVIGPNRRSLTTTFSRPRNRYGLLLTASGKRVTEKNK